MRKHKAISHSLDYYDQTSTASTKDRTNKKDTDVIPVIAVIIYFTLIAGIAYFG